MKGIYSKYKHYGFFGSLGLCISICYSFILSPKIRVIRLPADIRGRHNIDFGNSLTCGRNCRLEAINSSEVHKHSIVFGNNVQLNDNVHIVGSKRVVIGSNVLVASGVFISDTSHGYYSQGYSNSNPETPPFLRLKGHKEVIIEDNVWIGEQVIVLPGVQIGYGAIIGAGSLVTRNVPPNTIVTGTPAKPFKKFNKKTGIWERIY